MAQLQLLQKYNQHHNQEQIQKATKLYQRHQRQRHEKRNFNKDIKEYKQSIKVFKEQYKDCNMATVKQLYLDSFREDIDPEAKDDIFHDVLVTESPDDKMPTKQSNSSDSSDDDSESNE